ncbi:hypothetical protein BJ508DRAFT_243029 [Ascobolus immersus RN42]|uniref:Lysine-specific metallo-endopeptidase domain-containing protein n=1 Tax=Ascobolus immersus RN42 TaxID=1160509 RepID=A0A3N4I1S8_ASCIM|nr:hypothetical protein BJ508DRAFT_243029 [Ascobolus immersus RN42]
MPSLSALLCILPFLSFVSTQAPPSSKSEWASNGVGAVVKVPNGGLNSIPYSAYTKTKWTWGKLPQHCYNAAMGGRCNVYDVEAYDIQYTDCSEVNVMCRCSNAQVSIDQLANDFGRVPVKARQWANYVSAWSAPSCSAASNDQKIDIYGDCNDQVGVYFHEVAHSLDGPLLAGIGAPHAWSYGQEWQDLVALDTCVADNYARASYAESWAQVAVMAAYHANVQDIFTVSPSVGCIVNQVSKVIEQIVDTPIFRRVAGQTCDRWWPKDPTVCMGPEAEAAGACIGITSTRAGRRFVA